MKDRTILRTALASGTAGLILLFVLTRGIETSIGEIEGLPENSRLAAQGVVLGTETLGNKTIIRLEECSVVPVVFYGSIYVRQGDELRVTGRKGSYRGMAQVEAERIERTGP